MLRIPKGRAPWLTARYLFLNNLPLARGTARLPDRLAALPAASTCSHADQHAARSRRPCALPVAVIRYF
jgi:hypothetical protein